MAQKEIPSGVSEMWHYDCEIIEKRINVNGAILANVHNKVSLSSFKRLFCVLISIIIMINLLCRFIDNNKTRNVYAELDCSS